MGDQPVAGARTYASAIARISKGLPSVARVIGRADGTAGDSGGCCGTGDPGCVPVAALISFAPPRLHSALVHSDDGSVRTIAFYAANASTEAELAARLRGAHGAGAEIDARRGFDPGHPLLSAPVVRLLSDAAARPAGSSLTVCVRVDFPSGPTPAGGELTC